MRWRLSTGVAGAALMAIALTGAMPAAARSKKPVIVELVGSLTITWHGDPARGCAAEGVCGVSGALEMLGGDESNSGTGRPLLEFADQNAVARVTDVSGAGATPTTCADLVPVDFAFTVGQASTGALGATVAGPDSLLPPSSGRCAGPTASDLQALELPARKLGAHGYDLSGQSIFGAGPFAVTATSTVRALFNPPLNAQGVGIVGVVSASSGFVTGGPGRLRGRPATHHELQEHAELVYRMAGYSGALSTSFAGLASPLCEPLGACGTSGELTEAFTAAGTVTFFGSRIVKHRVGAAQALRDLRAARLEVFDTFGGAPISEQVDETLTGPGSTSCSDQAASSVTGGSARGSAHELGFVLGGNYFPGLEPGSGDPLRTRCPGPSGADVFAGAPLASAELPISALGARTLSLTFHGDGAFTAGAYGGERSGSVGLTLVLERAQGGTSRVTVARGVPLPLPLPLR